MLLSPPDQHEVFVVLVVLAVVIGFFILTGLLSLMLSIPLFIRAFREKARLKTLGLSSLSKSLLTESRRSRRIGRIRRFLLNGIGVAILLVWS